MGYRENCPIHLSPFPSPKSRIWDLTPMRQYLSIRPFSRRYRIWDIAPCPCLSTPPSHPEILISFATVSIRPPCSRRYRIWDIASRQYLSIPRQYLSIPLCSPRYEIWDMPPARQYLSIYPTPRSSPPIASVTPHVYLSIYLPPTPWRRR